ncbi:MAG: FixH family protein [Bacteroidia bacterium]|nr:FixH family protein [Bacteroidia bacterium]
MNTSALIMIIVVFGVVTGATGYFLWLAVKTPPKLPVTEDSYLDNDPK